jgi:undecaprenyl-diphosphatase
MNLDILIFQQINIWLGRYEWLDFLGMFFANYLQYILAVAFVLIFRKNLKAIFWSLAAVFLSRIVFTEIIRILWPRQRPFFNESFNSLTEAYDEPSFPSGHAALFFALSAVIYFYNKKAGLVFLIASFLISLARVFIGVHWPTDILAGAILGIFSGWLVNRVSKRF